VAATRAGVKLVISQRDGKSNEKNPWRVFDGFLQSAQTFADPGPVIASELWRRAQGSQRFLAEVPVAMPVPAAKAASGLPTVLRGVIDLAFLEAKGWVLVDYKSERVEEGDLAALVEYYRPQIEAYAEVWEKIVGQPVVERGLFFTHTGRYVTV
jgi:ATP-dependent helicase/nuclease subunit A